MRDKWGDSVFRNVVPTSDFSLPSEENIGETHKKCAKTRRATVLYSGQESLKVLVYFTNNNQLFTYR